MLNGETQRYGWRRCFAGLLVVSSRLLGAHNDGEQLTRDKAAQQWMALAHRHRTPETGASVSGARPSERTRAPESN